ncbi:MAG: FtsW/RodA/SpoVE family cell cycle protein [Faecalibacterium sp.]|nr:FtsW/RodA/SpoVE family cell cycle protein [Faecalibacterium sp.]
MPLLINLGIILVFGLIMLFSASYTTAYLTKGGDSYFYIKEQVLYAVAGTAVMLVASRVDYHWVRRWTNIVYFFSVLLLLLVLTCEPINGCRRWLHWNVAPLKYLPTVQVSEIVKFEMALMTANIMCVYRTKRRTFKYGIIYPLLPLIPVVPLMLLEPHLSGTVIICAIVGTVMLLGGSGGKWIPILVGSVAALAGVLYGFASDFLGKLISYVGDRLDGWTWDLDLMPWQTKQSLYAIGSGGLTGVGLGNSMEKQLWLPECVNDFIFSVICEELGFMGALMVIILFVLLIGQCLYVAFEAADLYGSLVALGITAQIAWQVFFNIGVVTNTLPNTGISLPFFSSGGTSLLMLLGEMGILLSIARAGRKARAERRAAAEAAQNQPQVRLAP